MHPLGRQLGGCLWGSSVGQHGVDGLPFTTSETLQLGSMLPMCLGWAGLVLPSKIRAAGEKLLVGLPLLPPGLSNSTPISNTSPLTPPWAPWCPAQATSGLFADLKHSSQRAWYPTQPTLQVFLSLRHGKINLPSCIRHYLSVRNSFNFQWVIILNNHSEQSGTSKLETTNYF